MSRRPGQRGEGGEGVHLSPSSVTFGLYTSSEVRLLSTCHISNPQSFNSMGHPNDKGLYDLHMGPFSDKTNQVCQTCFFHSQHCPGHMGHIELPVPVVNPLLYSTLLQLLKLSCVICNRFRLMEYTKELFQVQMKLLDHGLIIPAEQATRVVELTTADEKTHEDGGRKRRSNSRADDVLIAERLRAFCQTEIEKAKKTSVRDSEDHVSITRSVEALRKHYRRQFLTSATGKGSCRHCNAYTKNILHNRSKFIFEGNQLFKKDDEEDGSEEDNQRNDDDDEIEALARASGVFNESLKSTSPSGKRTRKELTAEELRQHCRLLWAREASLLTQIFPTLNLATSSSSTCPIDVFFLDVLAIPPPKCRPCMFTGGTLTLHPQSTTLTHVLETTHVVRQLLKAVRHEQSAVDGSSQQPLDEKTASLLSSVRGKSTDEKLRMVWYELQGHVDRVLDREMKSGDNTKVGWGLKQLVEKKEGLLRMNMMGKRVNFAARSVITPDPFIDIDEIGVPEVFAKRLSYRVPITHWNVDELRKMVINGPDVHPGALCIEYENGLRRMLDKQNDTQRLALAKMLLTPSTNEDEGTKFVYRHLLNGDPMLLNRQPTLHKPSIMAHKARVLKGQKVMRLHYAVCKAYNADFDGDEMNAHFPQNEVARSEAHNIANVCQQYLVPKDGSPLQGLIQDHIISGVKMTIRGRFFEKEEYQQLVMGALVDQRREIRLLPPSILKPKELWSGKQIISTILINIITDKGIKDARVVKLPTLVSSSKVKSSAFSASAPRVPSANMDDTEVIFRKGEMLSGLLDKNAFGATSYGLVHCLHELYGGHMSAKMLSCLSKLFTHFLQREGFSLGVKDIVVTKVANDRRRKIMKQTRRSGKELAARGVGLSFEHIDDIDDLDLRRRLESYHRRSPKEPHLRAEIDRAYKTYLDEANNAMNGACVPRGLEIPFPLNNLQLMVQAGAKGSSVNTMQISGLLGQIALEGKRPPLMISGRSLPSFRPYDFRPVSGGFIDGRFMSGIRPQEFFFHCMAGREGLIDTAVKTSRSGYLQRCLIKLLEGLVVHYDQTVRDSDHSVIQFQYGEDGLDVCKSQFIKKQALPLLDMNGSLIADRSVVSKAKQMCTEAQLERMQKLKNKLAKYRAKYKDVCSKKERSSPFLRYCEKIRDEEIRIGDKKRKYVDRAQSVEKWQGLSEDERRMFARKSRSRVNQTVTSCFRPDNHFGSVSETVEKLIENYVAQDKHRKKKDVNVEDLVHLKFMSALVEPGEPVGVLAAQSVGEPSTQMTLNTFHFAGRGEMNVTLGIPRLREILMVASDNIKTPMMRIPFEGIVAARSRDDLRKSLNRVTLADVLARVVVSECVKLQSVDRFRQVKLRFEFLPRAAYKDKFAVKPKNVLEAFEKRYVEKALLPLLRASPRARLEAMTIDLEDGRKEKRRDDNHDSDDDGDNSGDNAKNMANAEQQVSSDEEELPDDADATEMRKHQRQNDADEEEEFSEEEQELIDSINKRMEELAGNDNDDGNNDDKQGTVKDEQEDEGFTEMQNDESEMATTKATAGRSTRSESADNSVWMEEDDEVKKRRVFVMSVSNSTSCSVSNYEYDVGKELWCELTLRFPISLKLADMSNLVRRSAERMVVRCVPNIKRAFVGKNEKDESVFELTTEGVNIEAITAMPEARSRLDVDKLYCNNIHEVARRYGIEAANRTIVGEMRNVFRVYGIEVDLRHLTLIADFMTFDGSYKPFNRYGIDNNPSPLQQMTFETAIGFMRQATLSAKTDKLNSPSARIVLGQPCRGGTTSFEVVQNLIDDKWHNEIKDEQQ